MFSQTMCGLVVPVYTVNVTLRNIATGGSIKNRSRINVLAVECHLDGVRLSLAGMKLNFGVWAHAPAKDIPPRHAAIAACHNKVARPTGAGGVICYRLAQYQPAKAHHQSLKLVPVDCPDLKYFRAEAKKLCSKGGLKIWVLSHTTITNTQHIGVVVERPSCKLSRAEIIARLEADNVTEDTSYSVDDVMVVAIRFKPHPRVILRFHPKLGRPASHVSGSYPLRELSQHLEDNRTNIERRRVLTIILKNMSDATTVSLKSIQCLTGMPLPGVSLPSVLRAGDHQQRVQLRRSCLVHRDRGGACVKQEDRSSESDQRQDSMRAIITGTV
ncbi:Hypothetical protein, putative [Bodo saltans]|nr:Hypothetical protein, putative [Bodo saltans]|eukprot:CUG88510.1 Hypothetical protein, putative [Bodo saltans]